MDRKRVLIVDDNQTTREMIARSLKSTGAKFSLASGAIEALCMMEGSHHDIIISDIHMPHGDGLLLARQVKKNHSGTRLIAFSASDEARDGAIAAGFDRFCLKGSGSKQLLKYVF